MSVKHFTDGNFAKQVLESQVPVLVDFWAEWCGPCRMIAPVVEELAKEYDSKVSIGKLDVDSNPKTPGAYGVMSIPTLIFFKNGKICDQVVGVLSKAQLKRKIEENL